MFRPPISVLFFVTYITIPRPYKIFLTQHIPNHKGCLALAKKKKKQNMCNANVT